VHPLYYNFIHNFAGPMNPYRPLFRNPHIQTIAAHFWKRPEVGRPLERRMVQTEARVRVLVESQRPEAQAIGEIVIVHGLEGSGEGGYIRSLAAAAVRAGYAAHRFHMRTCGGTEQHADTLYHAGLTSDLTAVLRLMRDEGRAPAFLVGFSLGGNVVVKLAGELGESAGGLIQGVCGVSAPLDLAICAHRIHAPENRIYEKRFLRRMRARLIATGRYREGDFANLGSLVELDDRITAQAFAFGSAENYYRSQSALGFLDGIRVPVLLIQAKDDPLVPFETFQCDALERNPHIQVLATEHGGHLGFLARGPRRLWLDGAILEWIDGIRCAGTRI
jgi:predicted alpha/beta-fold hydrolase